jgi:hypothetical protein
MFRELIEDYKNRTILDLDNGRRSNCQYFKIGAQ